MLSHSTTMATLTVAAKAPFIPYSTIIASEFVKAETDVSLTVEFVDEKSVESGSDATAKLVVGEKTYSGELESLKGLAALIPSISSSVDSSLSWVEFALGKLANKNFKALAADLEKLDTHLNFRSFIVGYSYSLADIAVWGVLRANAVMGSVIKNAVYSNISRWYSFIALDSKFDVADKTTKSINELRKNLKAAKGEKKEGHKANFAIDLPNAQMGKVVTRFPPEPSGYLHIGHAKSICLNFGIGKQYNGLTNLRFDDTNPVKEDVEYVNSIMEDVKWLGFDWNEQPRYASDYFDQMYEYAKKLITLGKAYVDDQTADEIKQNRGDFSTPGVNSPYRERSVEENLALFEEMKAGKYKDGEKVLRAKIDMAHPNIVMRDPVIYRIVNTEHHNTGNEWKIYPMYDFAHPIEDAIERITHSICTLEFEVHRPLYDWVLEEWDDTEIPQQIEFARLNVTKMVMSKRKLRALVEAGLVAGWDDPRMPTISGLRRRGYTPEAIRDFCDRIGVAKADSVVDIALLEFCIREDLKLKATRPMVVIDPVKVVITNYPEGQTELCTVENNPENEELGNREVVFGREIYIERNDFMEEPVKKFFRLAPGKEVRLKGAYFITCTDVIKDENGNITEIHCTYDPETKSGSGCTRKVKGTLHWVEASTAVDIESRLYDYLLKEDSDGKDFLGDFNHDSLQVFHSKGEACLANTVPGDHFQFLRQGYFVTDKDSTSDHIVVNRIVGLRDSWAKAQKK